LQGIKKERKSESSCQSQYKERSYNNPAWAVVVVRSRLIGEARRACLSRSKTFLDLLLGSCQEEEVAVITKRVALVGSTLMAAASVWWCVVCVWSFCEKERFNGASNKIDPPKDVSTHLFCSACTAKSNNEVVY